MLIACYYRNNSLNYSYTVVSHHEAERAIVVSITIGVVVIEVENTRILPRISIPVTAAQPKQKNY